MKHTHDLVIIGGGPSGLSAAVYAAREGMKAVVVDKGAFGGMAALTETIDNYPGFPQGVGGPELIKDMQAQAERFGAESAPFTEVTDIEPGEGGVLVATSGGEYHAKAVLIATGSTYRQLGIPGEKELIGRGVHFCATCDGPLYKGKRLVVVGGGNSALQESLFLARFASHIDILVRSDKLAASDVLQHEIAELDNVTIHYNVVTKSLAREGAGAPIKVAVERSGAAETIETDGLFVFIGLLPNNAGLGEVPLDERGFVTSDAHYHAGLPGVFVSGDVRSGSTWQIASAVGEGVSAALEVRSYLDKTYPTWHKK